MRLALTLMLFSRLISAPHTDTTMKTKQRRNLRRGRLKSAISHRVVEHFLLTHIKEDCQQKDTLHSPDTSLCTSYEESTEP